MCIEKHVLVKKMFTNGLATMNLNQYVETHWLSGKENFPHAVVNKEGHAESSLTWKDTLLLISLKKVQL